MSLLEPEHWVSPVLLDLGVSVLACSRKEKQELREYLYFSQKTVNIHDVRFLNPPFLSIPRNPKSSLHGPHPI